MADAQRKALAEGRAGLAADTATMLSELNTQTMEARAAWQGIAAEKQRRRAGVVIPPEPAKVEVKAPPPPPEPAKVEVKAPPPPPEPAKVEVKTPPPPAPAEEALPDDLTVIRGIGASTQMRLNSAGIYTYAELAQAVVEDIENILGPIAQLSDVDSWIEQAEELAE